MDEVFTVRIFETLRNDYHIWKQDNISQSNVSI